jgi:F-type H+-transporting ATPase subunit delta
MSEAMSHRYAAALVDVVLDPRAPIGPDQAVRELNDFESMLSAAADLKHILNSPAVSRVRKRGVIEKMAKAASLSPTVRNFYFVVVNHGRADLLPTLRRSVEELIDQRRGIVRASLSSAVALADDEKANISAELARISGSQVRCEFVVDPTLLGGVIARMGSTVYDGSVRGKLAALKSRLGA